MSHPLDQLHREVAHIAYHFHWSLSEILDLPHPARRQWIREISEIHRRMSRAQEEG